jgi:ribonuclease III
MTRIERWSVCHSGAGQAVDATTRTEIEQALGYCFADPALLELAFVHASNTDHRLHSNERLEFLGDAVLGSIICCRIFELYPGLLEGDMTKIKSAAVSRRTCARITRELGIDRYLQLGKGMLTQDEMPSSLVAAVLEAVVGAMYMDAGYDATARFLTPLVDPHIRRAAESGHHQNFKSLLQQHSQRLVDAPPSYRTLDEKGPDHAKAFKVCVEIGKQQFPAAWGQTKKQAEQQAALFALIELGVVERSEDGRHTMVEVQEAGSLPNSGSESAPEATTALSEDTQN